MGRGLATQEPDGMEREQAQRLLDKRIYTKFG